MRGARRRGAALLLSLLPVLAGCAAPAADAPPPAAPAAAPAAPAPPPPRGSLAVRPPRPGESHPVLLPYDGRFADDPRFHLRVGEILALLPRTVAAVRERLGFRPPTEPRIRIRFADAPFSLKKEDRFQAMVETEVLEDLPFEVITIHVERLVGRECPLDYLLAHEVVHVFQGASFGPTADIPSWAVEGMADWGSGRGEVNLRAHYLLLHPGGDDPAAGIVGGLHAEKETWSYPEAWLAFEYLEGRCGPGTVRRLRRSLEEVPDFERALRLVAGMTPEDLLPAARAHAEARVRRDLPEWKEFVAAMDALARKRGAGGMDGLGTLLAERPGTLLAARILAERAEARIEGGDLEGAAADLAASARADRGTEALHRMRRWLGMRLDAKAGRWSDVHREAGLYLFDYDVTQGPYLDRVYVLFRQAEDELRTGTHRE